MLAAAAVSDGGVVAAGYTNGTWNGEASQGLLDFAAVKLDSAGTVLWRWQSGTTEEDRLRACVETADGNVVVAGYSQGSVDGTDEDAWNDLVAVKLDVNDGEEIWSYQAGTVGTGGTYAYAAAARADGSIVLAGNTFGYFDAPLSTTGGDADFAAVAIDENGEELWRWQGGPASGTNVFLACTALDDGSVILGGYTEGNWTGTNNGGKDFAMVKLNESGKEEWRWQGGTELDDEWEGAATATDGSIVLAGYTLGSWTGTRTVIDNAKDFAAMAVDEDGMQLWLYQAGTDASDDFNALTVRPDGSILLAGWTDGTWTSSEDDPDSYIDYATVLVHYASLLDAPSPGPISSPLSTPSPLPDSTSSSSTWLVEVMIGAAVGAVALLVTLGVCFAWRRRRLTIERNGPAKMTRNFPVAAPAPGAVPPLPSYHEAIDAP